MNRAERRRLGKSAPAAKTYVLTEDQIKKMKMDAVQEATRRAFLMFMSIPCMVLSDKFGFDKLKLANFMDYALIWYESVQNSETHLLELVHVAEQECGISTLSYRTTGGRK